MRLELLDPAIHRQQHLNDRLTSSVIDRLSLGALHTPIFDEAELCPPDQLNAYRFSGFRPHGGERSKQGRSKCLVSAVWGTCSRATFSRRAPPFALSMCLLSADCERVDRKPRGRHCPTASRRGRSSRTSSLTLSDA